MLILRRRAGEAIFVGDVEIEVVEISRSRVKLGIRAPSSVPVMRKEAMTVAQENRLASGLMADCGANVVDEVLRLLQRAESMTQRIAPGVDM